MKKNILLISIIILITIVLVFRGFIKDNSCNPEKQLTVEQLQKDFLKLRKILENNHPALYYFHARETLGQYFDNIYTSIDSSMLVKDFYILLSRVAAKANCGHTYLSLPKGYWESANKIYKYFPFKLYFQDRKAYVLKNYSTDTSIPLGAEILSVNNTPMSQIIANFLESISSDGLNQTYKYAKMNRSDYGLYPGYADFPESYQVTYMTKQDTITTSTIVEALTHDEILESRKKQFPKDWKFIPYDFKIIDSLNTAILTVRDLIGFSTKDFKQFLADAFSTIHQNNIKNLIIDVRDNDGGDPHNATAILSYLTDTPYIYFPPHVLGYWQLKKPIDPQPLNFKGNKYVLIDGGCFSTTGHFLSMIKYHNWATLIGEESGGSYICNGCVENYTLPNTKMVLNCSRCVYRTNVHGFTRERGIMPDIDVKPRIEDLINDRDTVMEIVLKIVRLQT